MSHFIVRQEEDRVASRPIVKVSVAAFVVGVIAVFFAGLLVETNIGGIRGHLPAGAQPRPPASSLANYRWLDRGAGVAAIPIDRAMDLVVRAAASAAPQAPPPPQAPAPPKGPTP
jgi:hypothetical protein